MGILLGCEISILLDLLGWWKLEVGKVEDCDDVEKKVGRWMIRGFVIRRECMETVFVNVPK